MRENPKRNLTKVNKTKKDFGKKVRLNNQNAILKKAPLLPLPLEYEDIDKAIFDFVDKMIDIEIDGKLIPTYTLFGNQRFAEYTQTWQHTDENGNLYLNFKTINREKNPSSGKSQGGLWNIPGNRKYKLLQREVLEKNGTESIEIYTMKQPYAVDLTYNINFITVTFENLNKFNQKINKLFAARQFYIAPNGHYIPLVIDTINDETSYSISERKFYIQSVTVNLLAYIIEKDDLEVKKYPKKTNISFGNVIKRNNSCVEIEEIDNPMKNKTLNVKITLQAYRNKIEFDFDTNMQVEKVVMTNARCVRVVINDTLYYTEKGFKIKNGDNIKLQIRPIDYDKDSVVQFIGYEEGVFYNSEEIPEKVSDEPVTYEEIIVD
jgi:hypothetical protein